MSVEFLLSVGVVTIQNKVGRKTIKPPTTA
jgi:hypothetical protein